MKSFRLALGTLTVIPCGELGDLDQRTGGRAMLLAPIATLPLGLLAGLLAIAGWHAGLPGPAVGLVVVAALAVATRAMHLDGLADTVDGLGGGWTRERALEIMRRGDVGPMGVTALLVAAGLQTICIGVIDIHPLLLAVTVVVARCALPVACARGIGSAREGGMGALVAGTVPPAAAVVVALLGAGALVGAATWVGTSPLLAALAALAAAVAVGLLLHRCARRLGGITGDVLGATVEVAFTVLLLVLAVVPR